MSNAIVRGIEAEIERRKALQRQRERREAWHARWMLIAAAAMAGTITGNAWYAAAVGG